MAKDAFGEPALTAESAGVPMRPLSFGNLATAVGISALALLLLAGCSSVERSLLFTPSHNADTRGLTPWTTGGTVIGYSRSVESPRNVWLLMHGNAGQAADRAYALPSFSDRDSVFILEYPGYGVRAGMPSRASFDRAATEAYLLLRETFPSVPVCVVGESLGSGPASVLAGLPRPPDKIVLIVPFDRLSLVANDHLPSVLVWMLLSDNWDNKRALEGYRGPVEIFGARDDTVIPVQHAKALAAALQTARLTLIDGGHNDWALAGKVQVRNP